MSRKIKIQTVDKTNLTNLENALNENLGKKHVTISGPEKTIIVSDDAHRSEEELKAYLERDKQEKKEIKDELELAKKIIKKIRNENIGDANADTNITSETLCQNLLKKYPHLKEKTSSILTNIDNNPLEENKQNRICVSTNNNNNDIQVSKKYVEEHIIPRKKELKRIDDLSSSIKNLDNVGEFFLSIPEENVDNKPYEEVNHPDHYNVYDVEVVEMMERIFGIEETMSWCKLNAFKYRMRAGEKPTSTVEKDLKKEKWCLNKYKELKSKK